MQSRLGGHRNTCVFSLDMNGEFECLSTRPQECLPWLRLLVPSGLKHREGRMTQQNWTTDELRAELLRFERELRAANLKNSSIQTYVDRSGRFLKWLDGDYHPRGPN